MNNSPRNTYTTKTDPVNHPPHYQNHGLETIDNMENLSTLEEFRGHLKCQIIKYLCRYPYKGQPCEDLRKAEWYLKRLIDNVIMKGTRGPTPTPGS